MNSNAITAFAYKCNNCWYVWHSYIKEFECRNASCNSTNIEEKIYEDEKVNRLKEK